MEITRYLLKTSAVCHLHFTPGLQSEFNPPAAFYPRSEVCSPQSSFYTDRFPINKPRTRIKANEDQDFCGGSEKSRLEYLNALNIGCFKFFLEFFLGGVPLLRPCWLPWNKIACVAGGLVGVERGSKRRAWWEKRNTCSPARSFAASPHVFADHALYGPILQPTKSPATQANSCLHVDIIDTLSLL